MPSFGFSLGKFQRSRAASAFNIAAAATDRLEVDQTVVFMHERLLAHSRSHGRTARSGTTFDFVVPPAVRGVKKRKKTGLKTAKTSKS
jgi:hypothetical protein